MSANSESEHVSHEGGHVSPDAAYGLRMILGIVLNLIIFMISQANYKGGDEIEEHIILGFR